MELSESHRDDTGWANIRRCLFDGKQTICNNFVDLCAKNVIPIAGSYYGDNDDVGDGGYNKTG